MFWFSLHLTETFIILGRNQQDIITKCMWVFTWSTHYSCQILMQLKHSQQTFENSSNIQFNQNLSSGSWAVPWGWMDDVETGTTQLIVMFHNTVNVPNNQETFQRNSSVHHINERNKHQLHKPTVWSDIAPKP
jgi:hypothetical protein